jgi:hypothetical protein
MSGHAEGRETHTPSTLPQASSRLQYSLGVQLAHFRGAALSPGPAASTVLPG